MKWVVLLLILLIPGALALSTDMKESYQPGETMISSILGEILEPINLEDVTFVRDGHVEVPFDYDLKKIENTYYIYALMPYIELQENESKTYALRIEGVSTTINGRQEVINFEQNFSVVGEVVEYTVKPGFIISSDDFDLQITLNRDISQGISIDFPFEREIFLRPGKNTVRFDLEDVSGGLYMASVGNYKVPVFVNKEIVEPLPIIGFNPFEIDSRIEIGSEATYSFSIRNNGGERVEDFSVSYNKNAIRISPEFPRYFEPGQEYEFEAVVLEENQEVEELLVIEYGNESYNFPIRVEYVSEPIVLPNGSEIVEVAYYCSELSGKKCSSQQVCSGDSVISRDVKECCLGVCTSTESSGGSWLGWLLGVILVAILVFLGFRYYRTKKKTSGFNEKVNRAEKKFIPIF